MAALLRRRFVAILTAFVTLAVAASVAVASPQEVLDDLKPDGLIQGCYSLADYDAALASLEPSDALYSDQAAQIEQAKIDHVKTENGPCPNEPTATTDTASDSNTAGYVVWGVVGGAIAIAAALGGVLARRSRRDGGDERDG